MKKINFFFYFFLFFNILCYSSDQVKMDNLSIFIDKENTSYGKILEKKFDKLSSNHINFGFNNKIVVWIKIELSNKSKISENKIIEINNPLLEEIVLYSKNETLKKSGMLNIREEKTAINPFFNVTINPNEKKIYYLKIVNNTTCLQFSINILNDKEFFKQDKYKQFVIISFVGIIIAFLIYAIALYLYTKDNSYLYYTFYIIALLFQQLTYVGFLPLYMPSSFTFIDNLIVVPKVGAIIITGIIFARSFLKTAMYKNLDNIYKSLIYIVSLQILFLSTPWFYHPEITVVTGLIFIVFNYFTAIYVYIKGNKQARFYIAGWSFLIVGFFLSIIDALGIYSVMHHVPSLVLIFTSFEALFLLLAFVDKLSILQNEKDLSDTKLMNELHQRNVVIEKKVKNRTKLLNNLYKELHHRVKNNLQIMLSIINLQADKSDDKIIREQFLKLENRIRSISKTHEILYLNDNINKIDMYEYIYSLCEDISNSFDNDDIEIKINSNVKIPLREAVYIGMIINELISNTLKYAINCNEIKISLLKIENYIELFISDNGLGYEIEKVSTNSLGLSLVNNLVKGQLSGEIEINTKNKCEYKIRFKI